MNASKNLFYGNEGLVVVNNFFTNKAIAHIRHSRKVVKIILKNLQSQNGPKKLVLKWLSETDIYANQKNLKLE